MDHAVGTLLVITGAVLVPVGRFHQFRKCLRIAFAQQVAGPLPAEIGARRVAPGRAVELLVAGQEVEEHRGLVELPLLLAAAGLLAREDAAEQFLGPLAVEEMLLVGRALIGIAGGDADLHAHGGHLVKEGSDLLGLGIVEQGSVDDGAEAALLGLLDRSHGAIVHAFLADRTVMLFPPAIQMHGPGEVRARLEQVHLLFQQQRIGADDDEFLPRDAGFHNLVDFLVQQRLSTGDHHHRRAAFIHRLQAFGDRQALVQNLGGIVDLAAAGAGEVAAEQWLQHQHQRVALAPDQMLLDHIGADTQHLIQWNGHSNLIP